VVHDVTHPAGEHAELAEAFLDWVADQPLRVGLSQLPSCLAHPQPGHALRGDHLVPPPVAPAPTAVVLGATVNGGAWLVRDLPGHVRKIHGSDTRPNLHVHYSVHRASEPACLPACLRTILRRRFG
jgi:hypothetical protein